MIKEVARGPLQKLSHKQTAKTSESKKKKIQHLNEPKDRKTPDKGDIGIDEVVTSPISTSTSCGGQGQRNSPDISRLSLSNRRKKGKILFSREANSPSCQTSGPFVSVSSQRTPSPSTPSSSTPSPSLLSPPKTSFPRSPPVPSSALAISDTQQLMEDLLSECPAETSKDLLDITSQSGPSQSQGSLSQSETEDEAGGSEVPQNRDCLRVQDDSTCDSQNLSVTSDIVTTPISSAAETFHRLRITLSLRSTAEQCAVSPSPSLSSSAQISVPGNAIPLAQDNSGYTKDVMLHPDFCSENSVTCTLKYCPFGDYFNNGSVVEDSDDVTDTPVGGYDEHCFLHLILSTLCKLGGERRSLAKLEIHRVLHNIENGAKIPTIVMATDRIPVSVATQNEVKETENFCRYIVVPALQGLDEERKSLAQLEIQTVLHNFRFK